ncbi:MAG: hypothetical protein ACR2GA_01020 [Chloroflexota bacterium]
MNLQFDRGDRTAPVGHALLYWRAESDSIIATYVSVPPIKFDLSKFMPGIFASAMQGMDLGDAMVATPIPPIPEEVPDVSYLQALAERRQDDLVFVGNASLGDPMRIMGETAEAARSYGDLYIAAAPSADVITPPPAPTELARYSELTQQEQLSELSSLTGRYLDSVRTGEPDAGIERQMRQLAESMPAKYRLGDLIEAIHKPLPRAQRLAELYIERCYKLYHEDYLDLERIDREIEAAHG